MIVIAILSSVVLLFRCAAPPRKHKSEACEQLSEKAMLYRIETLAKRCSAVRRGFGVYYRDVKPTKLIKDLYEKFERGSALEEWEKILLYNSAEIINAFKKGQAAMRMAYTLGAVDGYPRLYLLCDSIVRYTGGNISASVLDKALETFDRFAPLTPRELSSFSDILRFCLCRLMYDVAVLAQKRGKVYSDGVSDGNIGKVDLDSIKNGDYVCGLCDSASDAEQKAIERVLEANGASNEQAELSRRLFLARSAACILSASYSLGMLDRYSMPIAHGDTAKNNLKTMSPFAIRICGIAPIVLSLLCAVLVCIFVPARYSAIVGVVSLILYSLFRLPVLLYVPDKATEYGKRIEAFFKKRINIERPKIKYPMRVQSEIAYFGGEADRVENVLRGKAVTVTTDNRGKIVIAEPRAKSEYDLFIFCKYDGKTLALDEFDGIFDKHVSLYNIINDDMELRVKLIAAVENDCCCSVISVINRTPLVKKVSVYAVLIPKTNELSQTCKRLKNCAALVNGKRLTAIACTDMMYQTDLDEIISTAEQHKYMSGVPTVTAQADFTLDGFSSAQKIASVIFGENVREAESLSELTLDKAYVLHAENAARVFCANNSVNAVDTRLYMPLKQEKAGLAFESPELEHIEYAAETGDGGVLKDGAYAFDPTQQSQICETNIVCTETCGASFSAYGVEEVFSDGKTVTAKRGAFERLPRAFTVIGEGDLLWSPTLAPLGAGNMRVVHGLGFTEYVCGYNGSVCSMKCTVKNGGIIFDVSVENRTSKNRNLEIMFSALFSDGTAYVRDGIPTVACGGKNVSLLCSERIADITCYKEGYYTRGKIARTSNFCAGGSSPAPTLCTKLNIKPHGKKRVVFALVSGDSLNRVSAKLADECIFAVGKFADKFKKIELHSSDGLLNFEYIRALYRAYTDGFLLNKCSVRDSAVICGAIKYVDSASAKKRLFELLRTCAKSDFDDIDGRLYTACGVIDYAEFTHDYSFLDERVPIKDKRNMPSVARLCLNAAVTALYGKELRDPVKNTVRCRQIIDILRYFGNGSNNSDELRACINRAVIEYSQNLKALKYVVYTNGSAFEVLEYAFLLFRSGEYGGAYGALQRGMRELLSEDGQAAVAYALFYMTVTQQFLGVSFAGERVRICPRIAQHVSDMRFDINAENGKAHIIIDNSVPVGDWVMRVNNVSYCTESININNKDNKTIVFKRNGRCDC